MIRPTPQAVIETSRFIVSRTAFSTAVPPKSLANELLSTTSFHRLQANMNLATLGALIWDILSSIPNDYRLIRVGKPSVVSFVYFMTRPALVITIFLTVLLLTGPVSHCGAVSLGIVAFQVTSFAVASYLFLKRVHAVYFANKVVQHTFSCLSSSSAL
ncbi:hypothetical protein EDD16DRAFT_394050 [Pisolithus croceorrhizus]|nr:hypothetical protein EDD16DRAFT_394050 [Pisolithus croceorrhizus]KAI6159185.1 hypothetical protein EDD17DRAFT_917523 [Pisolithus thermaeus]